VFILDNHHNQDEDELNEKIKEKVKDA